MTNDSYSASYAVKAVHNMPHLNANLQTVSNSFDFDTSNPRNEYVKSLVVFPAILLAFGLAVFILVKLFFYIRYCCFCCFAKPAPKTEREGFLSMESMTSALSVDLPSASSRRRLVITFLIFCVLALVADFSVFFGNSDIGDGFNKITNALDFVHDTFQSLNNDADFIKQDCNTINNILLTDYAVACSSTSYADVITSATASIDDLLSFTSDLPSEVDKLSTDAKHVAVRDKNYVIWFFFSVSAFVIFFYLFAFVARKPVFFKFGQFIADIYVILIFILWPLILILLMFLADFCMDPITNAVNVYPSGSVHDTVTYYATCTGTNPIAGPLNQTQLAVEALNMSLYTLCPSAYAQLQPYIVAIDNNASAIDSLASCPPIRNQIQEVVNKGLCTKGFDGLFVMWSGQYVTAALMWILGIVVTIICFNFDKYWRSKARSKRDQVTLRYLLEGDDQNLNEQDRFDVVNEQHNPYPTAQATLNGV